MRENEVFNISPSLHPAKLYELACEFDAHGPALKAAGLDEFNKQFNRLDVVMLECRDKDEVLGFWILTFRSPDVVEVHTCMSNKCRGKRAVQAGKQGITWVFTQTSANKVVSYCPSDARQALPFAMAVGMKVDHVGEDKTHVSIGIDDWFRDEGMKSFEKLGHTFHELLFTSLDHETHPDDDNHDAAVGLAWYIAAAGAGPEKAEAIFNRWAAQFGYAPVKFLTRLGDWIYAQIQDHIIRVNGEFNLEVVQ